MNHERSPVAGPPPSAPIAFRYSVVPADRDRVRDIVESTGFFHSFEVDVAVELVDQRLAQGEASGYYFVFAEADGQTLGYTCYGPIAATVGSFDLYWIAVHRAHQGRKLGRVLLEESERLMRAVGARGIYAETSNRPQYAPTRTFYEHFGYRCAAVLKDFYAVGDDKVIYVREV